MEKQAALERLHVLDRDIKHLSQVTAILQWDQETYMPSAAVEGRSEQLALLEGILHEKATSPEIGNLLEQLGSTTANPKGDTDLPDIERDFLRVVRKNYDRAVLLPAELVTESARAEGLSQAAWVEARKQNDYKTFMPHLEKMIGYAKKKAECWGYTEHPYDGLLDIYEPGMTEGAIAGVFGPLRTRLSQLVQRLGTKQAPRSDFLAREFPRELQAQFGESVMKDLAYDQSQGRLDISAHPFTTTLGPRDVRITTRYFPTNVLSGLFSIIHETGHALYEMGFADNIRDSSLGDGASMGIHESQSRLWENVIGRSFAFWKGQYPLLKQLFSDQLADVSVEEFYAAVNRVQPSLIRVDADEVTYSLHVILRFELERKLFSGNLTVTDLPEAWNGMMQEILGVKPDSDANGVLQDVHWSMGAFGYFPSYALGNLYGLQIWEALQADIPDVEASIEQKNYAPILQWLRAQVHVHGCRYEPKDLIVKITGKPLSAEPFINYLEHKYGQLYAL
jgi:carboxypeptidase Taq